MHFNPSIPQLSKKLTVFHPVGLYIRGVPFVITVIMINSVVPSYYTHLSILLYIALTHTPICTEHAPEIDGSEHAKDGEHVSTHCT